MTMSEVENNNENAESLFSQRLRRYLMTMSEVENNNESAESPLANAFGVIS